jgi:hypothetical protein
MQRTGAAEGEEREVARVVAARQRHHADRAGHVGVGEADRRRRGLFGRDAERDGDLAREDRSHMLNGHRVLDGEQPRRVKPAEDKVCVGDGRPQAAAAISDRAGIGAGAFRPDLKHSRPVDGNH